MGGRRPSSTATTFSAAIRDIAARVASVALPRWGRSTAFAQSASPSAIAGSSS